jgi:hypothetical protein
MAAIESPSAGGLLQGGVANDRAARRAFPSHCLGELGL